MPRPPEVKLPPYKDSESVLMLDQKLTPMLRAKFFIGKPPEKGKRRTLIQ